MPKLLLYGFLGFAVPIILTVVLTLVAGVAWEQKVKNEVKELFAGGEGAPDGAVSEAELAGLPPIVQKWLRRAGVVGKPQATSVRLKQQGVIRTAKEQPWLPFTAVQYYTVAKPGFIWSAKVKAAPLIYLVGRDRYFNGAGHMLIKLLALKTVADGKGPEINQGALLRFLSEIMWFPSAALADCITWEPVDAHSARATMTYQGVTASGVFTFSEEGDPVKFTARRYASLSGGYSLETWSGVVLAYREFGGVRIPNKVDVMWNLATGDFSYWRGEITDIEYNVPALY